jgi:AcrR family transcriptional regulator
LARARLTREESRALTRRRLLDSASEVFADKGFHGASVEEIAERAGFSRGAFYSNFDDKVEVFLALLDNRDQRQFEEVGEMLRTSKTPADFLEALRGRVRDRAERRSWFMLSLEFLLYAMRNPEVLPKLKDRQKSEIDAYAFAVAALHMEVGIELPAPAEQLGLIVRSLEKGLMLHEYADPESMPGDQLMDALILLFRASAALSQTESRHTGPDAEN